MLKTKFHVAFLRIYDVIRLHQVSGSSNYDDVMTEQVPGVSGANLVGRHLPSVPYYNLTTALTDRHYVIGLVELRLCS